MVYEYVPRERQAVSPRTAGTNDRDAAKRRDGRTGKKARLGRPVAGKTGTTQLDLPGVSRKANRDLWFVGYTSEWTAARWMGFDRTDHNNYMTEGSGKAACLPQS
ncbi:penicillin-binding transpeptidase domain-containing protein [Paenibacillus sp. JTLBN-2024]